jgi:hypothetical protein
VIVLVVILVVAAVGAVAVYLIMQYTGVLQGVPSEPRIRTPYSDAYSEPRTWVPRRLEEVPRGCLVSVLVAMAAWILLWLVVLVIGLRVLLA